MIKKTMPTVQLNTRSIKARILFQISAIPVAKYHKEYSCHIMPFSLLYCL